LRTQVIDNYKAGFASRLRDKEKGCIIVVQQRLHEEDLTGYLLEGGADWELLKIPAKAPHDITYSFGKVKKNFKEGELLHPARLAQKILDEELANLGSQEYSGQYMQDPVPADGVYFKKSWFRYYDPAQTPVFEFVWQSWDMAFKAAQDNDFSSCTTWGQTADKKLYLIDCLNERMEYPDLKRAVIEQACKYEPDVILIEDAASGQSVIQEMRRDTMRSIAAIKARGDKTERASTATPIFEAGKVFFNKNLSNLSDVENQLLGFPAAKHDDIVDSVTQLLKWSNKRYGTGGIS